jgi:2-dehydropantoate 2-reductase
MWEKLLLVVPLGGVGAATRRRFGELFGSANSRALLREAMGEVVAVARARGIGLSDEDAEKALAFLEKLPSDGTSSLQRDLEAGRPSEIEAWTGAVVRLARESGIPAPRHEALYRELKPRDEAARAAARGAQG